MPTPSLGRIILTHVIAGPPAGVVGLALSMSLLELFQGGDPLPPLNFLNGLPFLLAFGYILGALPAIITSLVMAHLYKRGWRFAPRLIAAPVVGALASCLCLFWVILGPNGGESKWSVVLNISMSGIVAALVSLLLLELWSRRRNVSAAG